ncbi:MAG: mannose-1-phosphate guanylyltransferase [Candidatus Aminicenantes bacterium]|nr:MAG: mannose-1-phosphate guanylyltransferase [Candidatus Aminicenantes bacterium]
MDIRAIIMAGGTGTRFWPLSKKKKPKQFLPIVSEKTMIEETVNRLLPRVSSTKIYTVADPDLTQTIGNLLPEIPKENRLIEPLGKNTAPSLMLATARIYLHSPKAVLAALPADHLIKNPSLFLKKLEAGASAAAAGEFLITFGIPPAYPATGYGYINFSQDDPLRYQNEPFYSVQEFKEKPDYEKARTFMEEGNYFWNSGMFLWQADVFAKKLELHAPSMFTYWKKILEATQDNDEAQIASIYEEIPSISIDYALMEKAEGVLMSKGDFGWSDVGAWSSLADIWPLDKEGNALRGESILLDSQNCLILNPNKLTALIGVKDIIVVDTEDALLIAHKSQDQKVKDVVEKIKEKGKVEYL